MLPFAPVVSSLCSGVDDNDVFAYNTNHNRQFKNKIETIKQIDIKNIPHH